ncbi:MAG: metallophosphoesterase [Candidatus Heimdallarchaeota archaeon]|nr:metallophosphoesterase [Candidatus Heimdallarchaeota archaeon]
MAKTKTLKKSACFGDIHHGKKANSHSHNQDCLNFVTWFCEQVRSDPEIDHVIFLGDWNENRSALNIATLNYSYKSAKLLNGLGIPVFFIVGNHDLYHRHTREIHSVVPFQEFDNFIVIDEPTLIEQIGDGALLCPYLFPEEYPNLVKYIDIPFWAGHFEFKGFMVTGHGMIMPTGPNHEDFNKPKHIISGHFHKRQAVDNIVYMGNTFPMDFGDAGDVGRGMMTYNHVSDEMLFIDWVDCPKYTKTKLSDLLDKTVILHEDSRVKCVVDIPISFEESQHLRQSFTERYNLREFTLEESHEIRAVLSGTDANIDWEGDNLLGVNELVMQMLNEINSQHINNQKLVEIYQGLKPIK